MRTCVQVHSNLAAKHRATERMVQQVVRDKVAHLEEEMVTLIQFGRDKIVAIPKDALRAGTKAAGKSKSKFESKIDEGGFKGLFTL